MQQVGSRTCQPWAENASSRRRRYHSVPGTRRSNLIRETFPL